MAKETVSIKIKKKQYTHWCTSQYHVCCKRLSLSYIARFGLRKYYSIVIRDAHIHFSSNIQPSERGPFYCFVLVRDICEIFVTGRELNI